MINTDTTRRSQRLTHEEHKADICWLLHVLLTHPEQTNMKFEELLHVGILSLRVIFLLIMVSGYRGECTSVTVMLWINFILSSSSINNLTVTNWITHFSVIL